MRFKKKRYNKSAFRSTLSDKEINQEYNYYTKKLKNHNNSKKTSVSNLPKIKSINEILSSKSSPNLPKIGFIYNKRNEYKLHPIRRISPKNTNNSKNILIQINRSNTLDKNRQNDSIKNNYNNLNLFKSNKADKKSNELSKNFDGDKNNKNISEKKRNNKNRDEKNHKKKKRHKKNKKFDLLKNLFKHRRLFRIKNLYDSNDDDESEEEIEDIYVINPETNIIILYDFLIIAFFVYNFIVSTFSLCILECFCQIDSNISYSDYILFINDLLYISDLILSFFRGFYNFEYKLIKLNRIIVKHYLISDFIFDLLGAIPIFSISKFICLIGNKYSQCFKYEMPGNLIFLRLCSILKILKIKKIINNKKNKAMNKLLELFSENYTIENIIRIFINSLVIIGILHCIVCIHIFLGNHSYLNWIVKSKAEDQSLSTIYTKSLYFIIATLTTIGYGDVVCQSFIERIFQIILLIFGSIIYPLVISYIGNIINKRSNAADKQEHDISMLEKIRKDHPSITFDLYMNIYNHLESKANSLAKHDVNSFIETLPFSLKNNILFTMYNKYVSDFKFFRNNHNSVFIAETLNSFIPSISRKDEFLIYEGELVEEIIFIKDGKLSFNAAINIEEPSISVNRYFHDNFSPFTIEEEKKLIKENMDKMSYSSTKDEITYDNTQIKLNKIFSTIINPNEFHLNQIIEENTNKNDYYDKRAFIINNNGKYHYLKVVDLRKNEHFGCVLISLNRPCPLSLQVKSKIVELFLIKKDDALNLSKNYPNIWRKLYEIEFHNIRMIKNKTLSIVKKYIELNEIFINKNLIITDEMTNDESNSLEKTLDNFPIKNSAKLKEEVDISTPRYMNFNNRERITSEKALKSYIQFEIQKNLKIRRSNTFSGTNIPLIQNKKFESKLSSISNQKSINYENMSDLSILNKESKKSMNLYNKDEKYEVYENSGKVYKKKSNKQKLKNLKYFLIQCKNFFEKDNYPNLNLINDEKENKDNTIKKKQKSDAKYINNQINTDSNKQDIDFIKNKILKCELNSNNEKNLIKFENYEQILKGLKDVCEEETNFSFCSTNKQIIYKNEELSINKNSNFEILSTYPNLNHISKGKYINDTYLQNKIKLIIQNYYYRKYKKTKHNDILSPETIAYSTGCKKRNHNNESERYENKSKHNKQRSKPPGEKSSKYKIKGKKLQNNILNEQINTNETKEDKKTVELMKENSINQRKRKISINSFNINYDKEEKDLKNSSNLNGIQENETINTNSIKANRSIISSLSNKSSNIKRNNSFIHSFKRNANVYNNREIEFIIDKDINKNRINHNIYINNNHFINTSFNMYKNRGEKYYKNNESFYDNKNNQLINRILGIKIPNNKIIKNNIQTTSSNINEPRDNYNSVEKIKKSDSSVSIYNIIPNSLNKNLYSIDNVMKTSTEKNKNFLCKIF